MRPLPYTLALALLSACAVQTVRRSADGGSDTSQDASPDGSTTCGACAPGLVCDASSKQCVQCTSAKDCLSGSCMSDQRCAPCSGNDDCNGGFCESSQCVQCRSEIDCGLTAPVCAGGTCQRCDSHADCQERPATPACDKGACVRCAADKVTACDVDAPYCSAENDCVRCLENAQCSAEDPKCSSNSCGACAGNADCVGRTDVPVCDSVSGDCVECTPTDAAKCVADSKVCLTGGTTCVGCNADADCGLAGEAKCDTSSHQCVPCSDDAQCAHIAGKNICSAGACVQCTREKRAACAVDGANKRDVCNAQALTCEVGVKEGSGPLCGSIQPKECVSNDQCPTGSTCVQEFLGEQTFSAWYCMPTKGSGLCKRPFAGEKAKPTRDGAAATVCSLRVSTCSAHSQYSRESCPSDTEAGKGDNAKCGLPGVADGFCVNGGGVLGFRCSVPCVDAVDCPDVAGPADPTCDGDGLCTL